MEVVTLEAGGRGVTGKETHANQENLSTLGGIWEMHSNRRYEEASLQKPEYWCAMR